MNLYLISQDANEGYNTYDSAVVAAEDAESARFIHPDIDYLSPRSRELYASDGTDCENVWVRPEAVKVKLLGETDQYSEPCVICSSFNAG